MVSPKDLIRHELIGLEARISDSSNKEIVGMSGRVIDETRNTIVINTKKGKRVFIKEQCVFSFRLPSGERVNVDGKLLVARPENRIKKKFRRW